ncbi:MAG: hypothetical protein KDB00_24185 [Planctomycetales bacterium]|nr:hypothetical protein [Planctomycetales bacterium]
MVQKVTPFNRLSDGQLFGFEGALYRKMSESVGVLILRAMRQKTTDDHLVEFRVDQFVKAVFDK